MDENEKIEIRVVPDSDLPPVRAGATSEAVAESGIEPPHPHDCWDHPVPYESDGALGHGWECGICGELLQVG
jgi:hypothetical protein